MVEISVCANVDHDSAPSGQLRSDFADRVLANVREDIRDEVAYALELATASD